MRTNLLTTLEALEDQQSDARSRMMEVLGKNFEATWLLLGDEEFFELGGLYIKRGTPDFNYYGENFPDFLMANDVSYEVIQMANFEKALLERSQGVDTYIVEADQENLENGSFDLSQVEIFESKIRLDLIWECRQQGVGALDGVALAEDSYFAIYKANNQVKVKFLTPGAYGILKKMKEVRRV